MIFLHILKSSLLKKEEKKGEERKNGKIRAFGLYAEPGNVLAEV